MKALDKVLDTSDDAKTYPKGPQTILKTSQFAKFPSNCSSTISSPNLFLVDTSPDDEMQEIGDDSESDWDVVEDPTKQLPATRVSLNPRDPKATVDNGVTRVIQIPVSLYFTHCPKTPWLSSS